MSMTFDVKAEERPACHDACPASARKEYAMATRVGPGATLEKISKGRYLQSETMLGRPFHENCVRRFCAHNAYSDQLDDDVLGSENRKSLAGNSSFL
jgi:hypothetical protein